MLIEKALCGYEKTNFHQRVWPVSKTEPQRNYKNLLSSTPGEYRLLEAQYLPNNLSNPPPLLYFKPYSKLALVRWVTHITRWLVKTQNHSEIMIIDNHPILLTIQVPSYQLFGTDRYRSAVLAGRFASSVSNNYMLSVLTLVTINVMSTFT